MQPYPSPKLALALSQDNPRGPHSSLLETRISQPFLLSTLPHGHVSMCHVTTANSEVGAETPLWLLQEGENISKLSELKVERESRCSKERQKEIQREKGDLCSSQQEPGLGLRNWRNHAPGNLEEDSQAGAPAWNWESQAEPQVDTGG
ncbi:hypothetical protein P7K49_029392 [Saguinus oedipus]|uniref:Uncharacterized protein n=1 Tax=Saguinus oedipus TaxID=9490 RepID=A0ABQ9U737_SAGOE|nr:hypothetical protein P7K49_029392 [Saguinus oedipus]